MERFTKQKGTRIAAALYKAVDDGEINRFHDILDRYTNQIGHVVDPKTNRSLIRRALEQDRLDIVLLAVSHGMYLFWPEAKDLGDRFHQAAEQLRRGQDLTFSDIDRLIAKIDLIEAIIKIDTANLEARKSVLERT